MVGCIVLNHIQTHPGWYKKVCIFPPKNQNSPPPTHPTSPTSTIIITIRVMAKAKARLNIYQGEGGITETFGIQIFSSHFPLPPCTSWTVNIYQDEILSFNFQLPDPMQCSQNYFINSFVTINNSFFRNLWNAALHKRSDLGKWNFERMIATLNKNIYNS